MLVSCIEMSSFQEEEEVVVVGGGDGVGALLGDSPAAAAAATATAEQTDNRQHQQQDQQEHHELYRIGLYYIYIELSSPQEHVEYHTELCNKYNLKGRVRVSTEGINGVVSGPLESIQQYERHVTESLLKLRQHEQEEDSDGRIYNIKNNADQSIRYKVLSIA